MAKFILVKLIWDDRDSNNAGWFARGYVAKNGDYDEEEYREWTFDADRDATSSCLITSAKINESVGYEGEYADAESTAVEVYHSMSSSQPSETVTI